MASLLHTLRRFGADGAAANARAELEAAHRQAVLVASVAHRVNREHGPVRRSVGPVRAVPGRAA